jgi:sugar phosphate isomerase/epimerase
MKSLAYLSAGNGCDPVEQIEAAALAGFDAVGLRPFAPVGLSLQHPIVGQPNKIRAIKDAVQLTGVKVLDAEVITLTAETDVQACVPVLADVAELGCGIMQVTCEDGDWNRGVDNFARLCDEAHRFGIRLAYEFMRWRTVKTIGQAVQFVTQAARPNGGIVLDTLHLSRSGGSPADVANVPFELLYYVQLCDAVAQIPDTNEGLIREARGGRLYPGKGTLWLNALFDVLPQDVPISIEVPPPATATTVRERAALAWEALNAWTQQREAKK